TSEAPRPLTEDAMAVSARQAVDAANQSLAEYQQIRAWLIWPDPDFPRTSTGKPRLAEITARAQQKITGAQTATATPNSLQDLIARFAAYNPSDHLEQTLNLTSLDRVELLSALEQRYQVELSETAFAEAKTVSDIETLLRQGSEPGSASAAPSREFGGMNLPIGVPNLPDNQVPLRPTYCYPRWTQRQPIRLLRLAIYYALVYPATQLL